MSVSGNARAPTKLGIAASDGGRPAHSGSRLDEAFLDLVRRESIKLTIPDGAHIRRNLRQMRSLGLSLEAEPHDQVRRDGDDFFPCRINEWQAH